MRATDPLVIKSSKKGNLHLIVNCEGVFRLFCRGIERSNGLDYKKALNEFDFWEKIISNEDEESLDKPFTPDIPHM